MAKLGIDSVAYLNNGTWDTPDWSEMDFISDFTENSDWDNAEIIIRRSWVKQGAKTVIDLGISCKMLREPTNADYLTILNALRTRDTVDILVLDADITEVGAEGMRYIAQVHKGGGSQNTGEALFRDIVFVPYPDADLTHIPQWADVDAGPTVTYTPITAA